MTPERAADLKQRFTAELFTQTEARGDALDSALNGLYAPDAHWRGAHPLNEKQGTGAILNEVWQPLVTALPNLERRDSMVIAGTYRGRELVGLLGHYTGTFESDWLGIPATGKTLHIRYGEVHEIENDKIVRSNCLWDILDVMRQAGCWYVAPSLGVEAMWPGPLRSDGINFAPQDPAQSAQTLKTCLDMQNILGQYVQVVDREELMTMPQVTCWHPKMMWYGPSGTGTCRGLDGFVDHHQRPFRLAFPSRAGGVEIGDRPDAANPNVGHYVRIGDGKFAMTGGWPSVAAMHSGSGWMGLPSSNAAISMRVMDFYAVDDADPSLIRENWVPIDVLHILLQMGVDVMARLPNGKM